MTTRKIRRSKKSNKRFRKNRSKRQSGGTHSDWKEKKTIEGQTYYHNINTGTFQMERPLIRRSTAPAELNTPTIAARIRNEANKVSLTHKQQKKNMIKNK